ncbi:PRC-barrel domain-containing protein [Thermostichus vulcanus]|uniref:PRC-barrel domain-containing protein n=1 Tax=Thermostichus vulcanus str. 'Rupite' TaxID=2813851 RepID=A0ABT0CE61_THEVL|nr:PRC-barrel domain-containing protein [Thermostichus vulcanus]MCJ2544071.1 PRC-barrel domain-containing protein [Thermostichus vulcanus str. 'Rupite']
MTTGKESVALVRSEVRRRSQVLGTQVISQGNAARLGVVSEVWADLEAKQVLVLGVLEKAFASSPRLLELRQVTALGQDAVLVPSDEVFDNLDLDGLSRVVGSEVVTEEGIRLGKVKDFEFNSVSGLITGLVLSNLGLTFLPGFILSTYLLSTDEIVSVGGDRLIVEDGAETRLTQLAKGILETLGVGKPPWEAGSGPTPALPSAVDSPVVEEDYDEEYDEEYEAEEEDIYAEDEPEPEPVRPRRPEPVPEQPEWEQEYAEEDAPPEPTSESPATDAWEDKPEDPQT